MNSLQEEDYDDDNNGLLGRLSGNMLHRSRSVRIHYLQKATQYLQAENDAGRLKEHKPGPLKRLFRSAVAGFVDGYFVETAWTTTLHHFIHATAALELPFSVFDFSTSIVLETVELSQKYSSLAAKVRLIDLCVCLYRAYVLQAQVHSASSGSEDGDKELSQQAWLCTLVDIIGKYYDELQNSSHLDTLSASAFAASAARRRANTLLASMLHTGSSAARGSIGSLLASSWVLDRSPSSLYPAAGQYLLHSFQASTDVLDGSIAVDLRETLVAGFRQQLGSATKQQCLALSSAAWMAVVKTMSMTEWTGGESDADGLEGALSKLVKKAPESSAVLLAEILLNCSSSIDCSFFVANVGAASAVKMLKSNDEAVRRAGLKVVQGLSEHCPTAEAQGNLLGPLLEAYCGKGATGVGALPSSQSVQKVCVLWALLYCASGARRSVGAGPAAGLAQLQVIKPLQTAIEKELNGSVRLIAARVLGAWLAVAADPSVGANSAVAATTATAAAVTDGQWALADFSELLVKHVGMVGGSDRTAAFLLALCTAARSQPELLLGLGDTLATPLAQLVLEASKKPAVAHPDAVLALTVLLCQAQLHQHSSSASSTAGATATALLEENNVSLLFSSSLAQLLTSKASSGYGGAEQAVTGSAGACADSLGPALYSGEVAIAVATAVKITLQSFPQHAAAWFPAEVALAGADSVVAAAPTGTAGAAVAVMKPAGAKSTTTGGDGLKGKKKSVDGEKPPQKAVNKKSSGSPNIKLEQEDGQRREGEQADVNPCAHLRRVSSVAVVLSQLLSCSPEAEVRRQLASLVQAAVVLSPAGAAPALLSALWAQLSSMAAQQQRYEQHTLANFKGCGVSESPVGTAAAAAAVVAGAGAGAAIGGGSAMGSALGKVKAPVIPPPSYLVGALVAMLPLSDSDPSHAAKAAALVDPQQLLNALYGSPLAALALLVSAHPLVSPSARRATQVWRQCATAIATAVQVAGTVRDCSDGGGAGGVGTAGGTEGWAQIGLAQECVGEGLAEMLDTAALSTVQATRTAAQHALAALASDIYVSVAGAVAGTGPTLLSSVLPMLSSSLVLDHLLPRLVGHLQASPLLALTEKELRAYSDPHGALAEALDAHRKASAVSLEEVTVTNADRKRAGPRSARRGNFGADAEDTDAAEWAERVRREKAQKLQEARAGAAGGDEAEQAIREEVEGVRARVGVVVDQVRFAVEMWGAFQAAGQRAAQQSLMILLLAPALEHETVSSSSDCGGSSSSKGSCVLSVLLRAPIVGDAAFSCLCSLAQYVLDDSFKPHARDICAALRIVESSLSDLTRTSNSPQVGEPGSLEEDEELEAMTQYRALQRQAGPVLRVVQMLLAQASKGAFYDYRSSITSAGAGADATDQPPRYLVQPCSFMLIFPALQGVLCAGHALPGAEHSFLVLDSLWPSKQVFDARRGDALYVEGIQQLYHKRRHVLSTCLRVLAQPGAQRSDPSPEKVLLRVVTQRLPLLPDEWGPLLGELGLLSREAKVRLAVVHAAQAMSVGGVTLFGTQPVAESRLWMARFDETEAVSAAAAQLWAGSEHRLTPAFFEHLAPLLRHAYPSVRTAAARALAGAITQQNMAATDPSAASVATAASLERLQQIYKEACPAAPAVPSRLAAATPIIGKGPIPSIGKAGAVGKSKGAVVSAKDILSLPGGAAVFGKGAGQQRVEDKLHLVRSAVARAMAALGEMRALPAARLVTTLLHFLLQEGAADMHAEVRGDMVAAGRALIDAYGVELCADLRRILEEVLALQSLPPSSSTSGGAAADDNDAAVSRFDNRRTAAVVLLGATGRHLQKDDPAVVAIAQSLVEALRTPSGSVQRSVADCLVPLVQVLKTQQAATAQGMLEALVAQTLNGASYGERRGAALGVSAFVKGLGIVVLKQLDIITTLKEACSTGTVNQRQGALFAFECLSERLGLLFEPYITTLIDILLKSFSHSSDHVREAAQEAARVIMNKLSAHGVKQVLGPIMASLPHEAAWKSRQEGIRLLGLMAHCAPKQLAQCLPQVVPCLVQAGADPHPKVKESARQAMHDISSVIRNPEVARLGPVLLAALGDPFRHTKAALEALLECEFMHSIDAASLALLVPILARSLKDRGADLKRKSAAITGNMVTMVSDTKILAPYLPQVLPGLQDCLLDPIPDVRATSAKAIGSLFVGMGDDTDGSSGGSSGEELGKLVPWLTTMLYSESSPVERSGAAQGLAEICGTALGEDRVQQVLQSVLRLQKQGSCAREGLLWFLSFLPSTLGERYSVYIGLALPVVLSGLSDESDGVREVAMRAGQVTVLKMGLSHTAQLLPALSQGLFEEDWRIRLSSLKLLGELLCLVGDTSTAAAAAASALSGGDYDDYDDDYDDGGGGDGGEAATSGGVARVGQKIRQHLGKEQSDRVFAALYISRSDVSAQVRQCALMTWKSVVSNSPRTLLEVMPALVRQLIDKLASESETMRAIAGAALGEIVSKLGDKVLPAVVSPLRESLRTGDVTARQGVCTGLAELLAACNRAQAERYLDVLVPALQQALMDNAPEVSSQAARAFMTLHRTVGGVTAMDQIVPSLLRAYSSGGVDADRALQGLRELVQLRPRDLLDYLLPSLTASPVSYEAARALGSVLHVAGAQLGHYLSSLLPALVCELISMTASVDELSLRINDEAEGEGSDGASALRAQLDSEQQRLDALKEAAGAMMSAVLPDAVHQLVGDLGKQAEHEASVQRRRWGCWMIQQLFAHASPACCAALSQYLTVLLKILLSRVAELDKPLLQAVVDALAAMVAAVPGTDVLVHVEFVRNCINSTASAARHKTSTGSQLVDSTTGELRLPLLALPKSLDPLFAIYLQGLMNGSVEVREASAVGLGELAAMADLSVLKPLLIKTTGPLIRVVGDRYPGSVKSAILQTLMILIEKGGASLKAFAPQLQTTFVKALLDPSRDVRGKGATALGRLVPLTMRVDPLLTELCTLVGSSSDSSAIGTSVLQALALVLSAGGEKASTALLEEKVRGVLWQALFQEDEALRAAAASALCRLGWFLTPTTQVDLLLDCLDTGKGKGGGGGSVEQAGQVGQACGRMLGLGAVLHSAGSSVSADEREEAYRCILAGCNDARQPVNVAALSALTMMLSFPRPHQKQGSSLAAASSLPPPASLLGRAHERRPELRTAAQTAIRVFAAAIAGKVDRGCAADVKNQAIRAIKQAAKSYYGATSHYLSTFLPPLCAVIGDIDLRVKYEAERALKYLCEGLSSAEAATGSVARGQGSAITQALASGSGGVDRDTASFVRDFMKKKLSKLSADSDDEDAV